MATIGPDAAGTSGPARAGMIRRLFTWRMNLYRLMVGAVVLAIVLPSWVLGAQAGVVIACVLVVVAAVAAGTRVPSIREWLRR